MTTTEPTNTRTVATPDAARDLVAQLVATGLPAPDVVTVREHRDEVSLSLALADPAHLTDWCGHLETTGAVDEGPWPMGDGEYRVAVGRLDGVLTVLAAEHRLPATT